MSTYELLQASVAITHLVAGVGVVVLSFRGLEEHPLAGFALGGGAAMGVIYLDVVVGDLINPDVVSLGWAQIEHLAILAAGSAALGVAITALSLRPERGSVGASERTTNTDAESEKVQR
jgi:hypothetical protein